MPRTGLSVPPDAIRIEDEVWQDAFARREPGSRAARRLQALEGGLGADVPRPRAPARSARNPCARPPPARPGLSRRAPRPSLPARQLRRPAWPRAARQLPPAQPDRPSRRGRAWPPDGDDSRSRSRAQPLTRALAAPAPAPRIRAGGLQARSGGDVGSAPRHAARARRTRQRARLAAASTELSFPPGSSAVAVLTRLISRVNRFGVRRLTDLEDGADCPFIRRRISG